MGLLHIHATDILLSLKLGGSTTLCFVKGRDGCHFEIMKSNQSDSISRCVFTWRTPDPIWNDGAFGFFEDGCPNNKNES